MSNSSMFWRRLFTEGRIEFEEPPQGNPLADPETRSLFVRSFEIHRLATAGPPLDYCEETAAQAAQILQSAAWYFVSNAGTTEETERVFAFAKESHSPSEHLSADLTLRYLSCIYQRAAVLFPADRLPGLLAQVLRRWPLSGVLAELPDAPLGDLGFGGHCGLLLLYAERLGENFKPAWIPRGPGAAYLEMVWAEFGKDPAQLLTPVTTSEDPDAPTEELDS